MSQYRARFTSHFKASFEKLKKRHPDLHKKVARRIVRVLADPLAGKPLKNVLKGRRRIHIGSHVLLYRVEENKNLITFIDFDHHDKIYKP